MVNPNQPHPGTRVESYRCSLPGLAGFTIYRCEGTRWGHHKRTQAIAIACGEIIPNVPVLRKHSTDLFDGKQAILRVDL